MAGTIDDIGTPGAPLSTPPLTAWQAAVRDAVHALEVGGSGSTILSGTATPTAAVGAVGDYYLDTDDHILYGPKADAAPPGPDETVDIAGQGASAGNGPGMAGMKIRFLSDGYVKAIRVYVRTGLVGTIDEVYLFTGGGALLASKDCSGLVVGWNTVNLSTPVPVVTGTTYVACFFASTGNGNYSMDSTGGSYAGQTVGNVNVLASGADGPQGVYNATRDTFPTTAYGVKSLGVSAVFTTSLGGDPWPVAIRSALDTWTAYTPTLTGCTASATDGYYTRTPGGLVVVTTSVTIATVTGAVSIGLPVAALRESNGVARLIVGGASYLGTARCLSGATAVIDCWSASGAYVSRTNISATAPATWVAGDRIAFAIDYQSAPLP